MPTIKAATTAVAYHNHGAEECSGPAFEYGHRKNRQQGDDSGIDQRPAHGCQSLLVATHVGSASGLALRAAADPAPQLVVQPPRLRLRRRLQDRR